MLSGEGHLEVDSRKRVGSRSREKKAESIADHHETEGPHVIKECLSRREPVDQARKEQASEEERVKLEA